MKKEKWLLKEIDIWQAKEIVNEDTANKLRTMYQPKKSISLLMVLFSVIGSILIGMGIVLVSANNWWYSLPIAIRTVIGFLPLVISQTLLLYVLRYKMNSTAFRESAALLNMAGVFASVAIVGQIFHLPGDFTNYLLVCGILFLPSMLIMNAISPLLVYYWTTINGGIYFSPESGTIISAALFAIGAVYALRKCRNKNGRTVYLSAITAIAAFLLLFISSLEYGCEVSFVVLGYSLLLLSASRILAGCEDSFDSAGKLCLIVSGFVLTYKGLWNYTVEFDSIVGLVITILLILFAVALFVNNLIAKKYCVFSVTAFVLLILRGIWGIFGLEQAPFDTIFMIVFNIILFALSIVCIFEGARKIDLYNANTGMVILCTVIIMRFFDSELPLSARGVVFLILGSGFLLFNLYLVKTKKKNKEETV